MQCLGGSADDTAGRDAELAPRRSGEPIEKIQSDRHHLGADAFALEHADMMRSRRIEGGHRTHEG